MVHAEPADRRAWSLEQRHVEVSPASKMSLRKVGAEGRSYSRQITTTNHFDSRQNGKRLGIHLTQLRAGSNETVGRTIGFCRLLAGGASDPDRPRKTMVCPTARQRIKVSQIDTQQSSIFSGACAGCNRNRGRGCCPATGESVIPSARDAAP